jgi:hypothetical protein
VTTTVDKSVEVEVPVRTAYDQWTQFEQFPEFMGGVQEVRQVSDTTLHWVAEIAGIRREWDAEVLEQVPDEKVARVLAYARLTFFGQGAGRLHDELITVAAPWTPGEPAQPYKDAATSARARDVTEAALAAGGKAPVGRIAEQARAHASSLYAALWPHLEDEADQRATEVKAGLTRRARKESDDMKTLIQRQRVAEGKAQTDLRQLALFDIEGPKQRRQIELDLVHLERRANEFGQELEEEPKKIEALYAVEMVRLSPVGIVIAWPEAMT